MKLRVDKNPQANSKAPWYIGCADPHVYLHPDLTIHESTFNEKTGQYAGYYKTREQARKILRAFKVANAPQKPR